MLKENLKTLVEIMELTGGEFPYVRIAGMELIATNGAAVIKRTITEGFDGFVLKDDLPMLKAIMKPLKKGEVSSSFADYLRRPGEISFPTKQQVDSVFDMSFENKIEIDLNQIVAFTKALKVGKNGRAILKIENGKPICIIHPEGKGFIAPCL